MLGFLRDARAKLLITYSGDTYFDARARTKRTRTRDYLVGFLPRIGKTEETI